MQKLLGKNAGYCISNVLRRRISVPVRSLCLMCRVLNVMLCRAGGEHTRYILCPPGGYSLRWEIKGGTKSGCYMSANAKSQGYKSTSEVINDRSSVGKTEGSWAEWGSCEPSFCFCAVYSSLQSIFTDIRFEFHKSCMVGRYHLLLQMGTLR